MKSIGVTIEGTKPLLINAFTDAAQQQATDGNRVSTTGEQGKPRDVAAQKIYLGVDGNPIIPQPNLLRCFIDAGSYFKQNKSKLTTQKSSMVPAFLEIDQIEIPIEHTQPWQVDTRPVVIPSTQGRIICHRPKFYDWTLHFTITIDTDFVQENVVRQLVDAAGKRIGLGDFRPARKGPFGRFVVTNWAEAQEPVAHAA